MKKIVLPAFFLAMATSVLFSMHNGALNMTGAPGELDCTGCHHPGPANSDPLGNFQILMPNNQGTYVPGQTYPITVQLQYPGKQKFGFSAAVRQRGIQSMQSGSLSAPASAALQITDFATHTLPSTAGNGQKAWTFNWTAPAAAAGTLVVYAAGVAANSNNEATGDQVYTDSLVLSLASSVWGTDWKAAVRMYPNPTNHKLWLEGDWGSASSLEMTIVDATGKVVLQEPLFTEPALPTEINVDYLPTGKYWLQLMHPNGKLVWPFLKL